MGVDYRADIFVGLRITAEDIKRLWEEERSLFTKPGWQEQEEWEELTFEDVGDELLDYLEYPEAVGTLRVGNAYSGAMELFLSRTLVAVDAPGFESRSESFLLELAESFTVLEAFGKKLGLEEAPQLYFGLTVS